MPEIDAATLSRRNDVRYRIRRFARRIPVPSAATQSAPSAGPGWPANMETHYNKWRGLPKPFRRLERFQNKYNFNNKIR